MISPRFHVLCRAALLAVLASSGIDATAEVPWRKGPVECYAVPAMSSIRRFPDAIPEDAQLSDSLRLIAAQGEFEPVSFLIAARENVAKLELNPTALKGPGGEIPASAIDIKIVKSWYQAGTAWYSYFGDPNRREFVSELLLNDENLIKVDEEKKENYLRVGKDYQWISYPADKAEKAFNYFTEPVADSRTLLPITLAKGRNKQIWVTVHVPKTTPGGIYQGQIALTADGKSAGAMDLRVRVLPFQLPMPKTYYNLQNDFLVTMYDANVMSLGAKFGLPPETIEKQQMAIYKNLVDHNTFNHLSSTDIRSKDAADAVARVKREVEMMKEAGFTMKPFMSSGWSYPLNSIETYEEFTIRINLLAKALKEALGHEDIYVTSWDEAGVDRIKVMRDYTEYSNTQGLKLWVTTAEGKHFNLAGYVIDYANHGGWPERRIADQWHAVGGKVASYAGPHTGPENPDVFRRWEGLARYKSNYDGSFNYKYYGQLHPTLFEKDKENVWNDFMGGAFRQFSLVYPTADGVVDTLAWEGFREGIDDIRYATKLKQEAAAAIASGNVKAKHEAKKALMWLELVNDQTVDLNFFRQETINYILKIQAAMAG